jgi:predicted methyltransferase
MEVGFIQFSSYINLSVLHIEKLIMIFDGCKSYVGILFEKVSELLNFYKLKIIRNYECWLCQHNLKIYDFVAWLLCAIWILLKIRPSNILLKCQFIVVHDITQTRIIPKVLQGDRQNLSISLIHYHFWISPYQKKRLNSEHYTN